ncbi:hypothetical protein EOW65_15815 [Sinirhodobacter ferrireducens]|uniref:Uncharacterized protein n=1 Tax=Paenirhodobacter ferrireducens TaxID=1215032 RepID=A0A443L977_9RHOB|nr:hypothetical protein [Sinirhodobacter ferrireducens]RWR45705.1 hypothetical protein EOW65_15815 [Sinirhodobacter ferrireducens]
MHTIDALRKLALSSHHACRVLARENDVAAALGDGDKLVRALRAARLTSTEVRDLIAPLTTPDCDPTPVSENDVQTVLFRAEYG